jgi:hypothetical protein
LDNLTSKTELEGMKKVQDNAYKHYIKSRPLAKSTMVRFAKHHVLPNMNLGIHPELGLVLITFF